MDTGQTHLQHPAGLTRTLLQCGMVSGPLFVLAFLILGATREDYHPMRNPVSALAIGELGWTQITNFLILGFLLLSYSFGLRRVLRPRGAGFWAPFLVGMIGAGFLGAGIFVCDPLNGYPPGTPLLPAPSERTLHGILHDMFSTLFFLGLPATAFVMARRFAIWKDRRWMLYSLFTGFAFLLMFIITSVGFNQKAGLAGIAGLLQRSTIIIGLAWLSLLAWYIYRIFRRSEALQAQPDSPLEPE